MSIPKTGKRSELKENILAHRVEAGLKWAQYHRPIILGILGGVIFIGLFSGVLIIRSNESRELNWTLLSRAYELMAQRRFDMAEAAFEDIVSKAPQNSVGVHARYWLGEQYLVQKKPDEAIEQFSAMVERDQKSQMRPLALTNLAVAFEQKGDFQAAADTYEQFMNEYSEHFLAARNQLEWGDALRQAGNTAAAEEVLGQLIDLYPTSQWAENAREIMDKIKTR